jgi:anti-anti-sigma regulatory factor
MLDVHREELPKSYLLVLAPSNNTNDEVKLTRALHRASRSEKKSIWVDCSLLDHLTTEAIDLLLAYAYLLHCQHRRLVLCHVPDTVRHHFLDLDAESQPLVVPSLLDAEYISRELPPSSASAA